jgi:hypothetical protein
MLPAEQIIPSLQKVTTSILLVSPGLVGRGARTMSRKDRFIGDRAKKSALYLRKEPSTDSVQDLHFLVAEFWTSSKIVVYLFISVLGFAIPIRITYLKHFLVKKADLPNELHGVSVWMLQKPTGLRIKDSTCQPMQETW